MTNWTMKKLLSSLNTKEKSRLVRGDEITMVNIEEYTRKINEDLKKSLADLKLKNDHDITLYKMAFLQGVTTGLLLQ